jgi:hypothetical protein
VSSIYLSIGIFCIDGERERRGEGRGRERKREREGGRENLVTSYADFIYFASYFGL